MFITETFAYLHEPKTGGTFMAATLARIHAARGDKVETIWMDPAQPVPLPAVGRGQVLRLMFTNVHQHGRRRHLPPAYAHLPLLATIRSPYDRYVSQFEFAWWRTDPNLFGPEAEIRQAYPHFPELTFEEFVTLANSRLVLRRDANADATPGFHTQQFVDYFTREPERVLPLLGDRSFETGFRRTELADLHFIDQARLNDELHAFLLRMGYGADEVAFVRDANRIVPPDDRRAGDAVLDLRDWRTYVTPELKAFIRRKERLLFELFPQFDV